MRDSPPTRGSGTRRAGRAKDLAAGRIAGSSRLMKYGAPGLIAARALPSRGVEPAPVSVETETLGASHARASSWGMQSMFPRGSGLRHVTLAALTLSLAGCDTSGKDADVAEAPSAQGAFWAELTALCGNAYGGRVAESVPGRLMPIANLYRQPAVRLRERINSPLENRKVHLRATFVDSAAWPCTVSHAPARPQPGERPARRA